jgi:cofilin
VQAFNDLKLGKKYKWIIYKISDDWKEIVVEETSKDADYSAFREKLLNAKSKNKRGEEGLGGRYAVYDVDYDEGDAGKRSKITFISWVPDDAPQYVSLTFPCSLTKQRWLTLPQSTASHDVLHFQGGAQARTQRHCR